MMLVISADKAIQEVQHDFSARYPFLKLDFYKTGAEVPGAPRRHLQHSALLREAGLKNEGAIEISDDMTVAELEALFRKSFGLSAQVSRKSGIMWLETTITDGWSLRKQNEHGKEISEGG
ncbi:MAG: hypothetical protein ABW019_07215 [Chitinophagaceae bacterium]